MKAIGLLVVALVVVMSLQTGGCASIAHGSSQNVSISTEPPGADVRLDNGVNVTTPSQIKLQRKNDYIVTISKAGYQTQVIPLNSVLSGWLAGNLVFGGLIGGAIDLSSGAAYTLTPEKISIALTPLSPGQADAPVPTGTMTTQQKLDILERLHKEGVVNDKEYEASKKTLNEKLKKEITGS